MFQQLHQYLLQFSQVAIPSVGTIELQTQPARLDVVDKLLYPPFYQAHFTAHDEVSEHQLAYMAAALQKDTGTAETLLQRVGDEIRQQIKAQSFDWTGIGVLAYRNEQIHFQPQPSSNATLPTITAERVIREKAQHAVLMGDREMTSVEATARINQVPVRKSYLLKIALLVAVLALLYALFYLYQHRFVATASGLQQKVQPKAASPTYK